MHLRAPTALVIMICAMLLAPVPLSAHHGWSSYDASKAVKVEVPLAAVRYQNPHGEIEIEHEGKTWVIVLAPVSRMQARGLPQDDLKVGETVIVEAYPRRDGEPEMRAERITVKGKTVELR